MGYLNRLGQRLQTVKRTNIDQTGVGEYFIEEARKSGVKNAEGTNRCPLKGEYHDLPQTIDGGGPTTVRVRPRSDKRDERGTIPTHKNRPDTILKPERNT
jgi:hypothetical protein